MKVTNEEFLRWKSSPITVWVLSALQIGAELQEQDWIKRSWDGGEADPMALKELRVRADAYLAMAECSYEDWCKVHEQQPEYEGEQ